jgi:hypothetical protein
MMMKIIINITSRPYEFGCVNIQVLSTQQDKLKSINILKMLAAVAA